MNGPAGVGPCRVVVAETVAQLDDATRIRYEVFAEAMRLGSGCLPALREINGYDVLPTTRVFVAYIADKAVGTVRLTLPNSDLAHHHETVGLPAAIAWDLSAVPEAARLVELNRVAILTAHRGRSIIGSLYAAAYRAARAGGYTHWLGTTLTGTDDAGDAAIVAGMMARHGGTEPVPRLVSRLPEFAPAGRRPLFGARERERAARGDYEGLRLSPALRFHLRTMVKVIGEPLYDEDFAEYLVPVIVDLDALARSAFGQTYFSGTTPTDMRRRDRAGPAGC